MRTTPFLAFSLLALVAVDRTSVRAQSSVPEFRVALAADPEGSGPQGLVWWRTRFLPTQPNWPAGTDPLGALVVHGSAQGLVAARNDVGDERFYLAGEVRLGGADRMLVACTKEGLEDWFVPAKAVVPDFATQLTRVVGPTPETQLRALDLAAACGLLSKGMVEEDPRLPLVTLGAAHCGEVAWTWWHNERELRVRGKSNGGLLLPALMLHLASGGTAVDAAASPTARHASLRLHALAGRDLTRNESIRQLVRAVPARAAEDLQSLLHSTGESKLFAMDALTRMGDAEHLPTILSAMELSDPASVSLASSALDELMPKASRAVEANVARQLELVPDTVREDLVRTEPAGWHVRAAAALGLVLVGLFGFWMRGYRSRSCGTLLRTHSSSQAPRW